MPNKRVSSYYRTRYTSPTELVNFSDGSTFLQKEFYKNGEGVLQFHAEELIRRWNQEFGHLGYQYSLGDPNAK